ncbi:MAG TPA: signal peptidase I [Tepidisphaeraceae bacterium]|jgi:signal peptidase I
MRNRKTLLRRSVRKLWYRHLRPMLILVIALTSFRSAVADWNDVPTGSMKPTIVEGDRIFVNKLAYGLKVPFTTLHLFRWDAPQRGEIVVFNSPADGMRLVKRVVGLPGDVVEMVDDHLVINGKPLDYQLAADGSIAEALGTGPHAIQVLPQIRALRTFGPVTVPPGEYFVMGDNRDNSNDSRFIGTVPLSQIVGRSSEVVLSLDPDHHYIPRWSRFFKSLD